jgi:hypothetical protein
MNAYPVTLTWYRSAAPMAWYRESGIWPEISTISQLTNWTRVNAP